MFKKIVGLGLAFLVSCPFLFASIEVKDDGTVKGIVNSVNFANSSVTVDGSVATVTPTALTSGTIDGVVIGGTTPAAGTFTSVAVEGTTPTVTIGDAGEEDTKIIFDGSAQDFHIGLDYTDDDLKVGLGTTLGSSTAIAIDESLNVRLAAGIIYSRDQITATDTGVAASVATIVTEVTTNGDSDLDNVTLADGSTGQVKHIYLNTEGNVGDTWKITPANLAGGTQITFADTNQLGEGATLIFDGTSWYITNNEGGAIT